MKLFDVYPLLPFEPVQGKGSWIWDSHGNRYLDLYGGHAVISIGHQHPHQVEELKKQLDKLSFYSNSVQNSLQEALAEKLGAISGYENYQLFLTNSGTESVENALKIASFVTGKRKVIAFGKAFHGRTSGSVAVTDNPKIRSEFCQGFPITFLPLNSIEHFDAALNGETAAVIIEGIQGLGGIYEPTTEFLQHLARKCREKGVLLILDEIQSGYGRTGKFFAHQHAGITPDLITVAKGMGNGFPIGGVLIGPEIKPWMGMLGTTFGGNHLACAAAMAVLEVLESENLMANAARVGQYLTSQLSAFSIGAVRGKGLMIGFDIPAHLPTLRTDLVVKKRIFTGESKPNIIRLLPALNLSVEEVDVFIAAMHQLFAEKA